MSHTKPVRLTRRWLFLLNVVIVLALILYVAGFGVYLEQKSTRAEIDQITAAVDGLSRRSIVSLDNSIRAVRDWVHYAGCHSWTADELLQELNELNATPSIEVQLLDPDTLAGRSAALPAADASDSAVDYSRYYALGLELQDFCTSAPEDGVLVTSAFTNDRNGEQCIAFVAQVPVLQEDGSTRNMLLMRLETLETLRTYWEQEDSYSGAQISLVNGNGAYMFRAPMLKNSNFFEFLRTYNDLTYPETEALQNSISADENSGWMIFKNAQGKDTLFTYSSKSYNGWYFVGCIEVSALHHDAIQWQLLVVLSIGFLFLIVLNAVYYAQIQKQLRQNVEALEVANSAKTRFLSSMSHDIRTPMNAIIGMTEVAQNHLNEPDRISECLHKVSLTSHHLLTLINDILDISQIESGKLTLSPHPFVLGQEIENLVNIASPMADTKSIDFTMDTSSVTHEHLVGDTLRLNQIWINILSNAIKYTPDGGQVRASFREVPIPDDPAHIQLVYQVADNGIGMSEEYQKNLFEPFTREQDGRIDKIEGSGLGMAITKQMVDRMHGSITVQSRQNVGSTFTVTLTLPCDPEAVKAPAETLPVGTSTAETAPASTASPANAMQNVCLLVAEDNDLNWEVLSELLELYGIAADRAQNGQECVDMLCAAPPDRYTLIFMDIQMPVLNGYEAARKIRALNDTVRANTPIIAMTADAFAEDVAACRKAGMNGHLAKPIDLNLVLAEIQKYKR